MTNINEIPDLVEGFAQGLSLAEPNPKEWGPWLIQLVKRLEIEAYERDLDLAHPEAVEMCFDELRSALIDRLVNGHW